MENLGKFIFLFFVIFIVSVLFSSCAKKEVKTPEQITNNVYYEDGKPIFLNITQKNVTTFMLVEELKGKNELYNLTYYFKDGKARFDMVLDGEKISHFILYNKTYDCMASLKRCNELGMTEKPTIGFEWVIKDIDKKNITLKSSRIIAGINTKCFGIISESKEEAEICLSDDAIPMYEKLISDEEVNERTVKYYSTNVSDSVFELPAEPQDINAMMQQYQP